MLSHTGFSLCLRSCLRGLGHRAWHHIFFYLWHTCQCKEILWMSNTNKTHAEQVWQLNKVDSIGRQVKAISFRVPSALQEGMSWGFRVALCRKSPSWKDVQGGSCQKRMWRLNQLPCPFMTGASTKSETEQPLWGNSTVCSQRNLYFQFWALKGNETVKR